MRRPDSFYAGSPCGAILVLASVPLIVNPYYVNAQRLCCGVLACLGLNLLLGHAGLLSLGHAAYFGLGAYTGGFLFTFGDGRPSRSISARASRAPYSPRRSWAFSASGQPGSSSRCWKLASTQMLQALLVSGAAFRPFGEIGKGFFPALHCLHGLRSPRRIQ